VEETLALIRDHVHQLNKEERLIDPAMEIACGTGRVFSVLKDFFSEIEMFDRDQAMVAEAKKTVKRYDATAKVSITQKDATSLTREELENPKFILSVWFLGYLTTD
jgi:protein-L-isoaspartate O-methyltransferase